MHVSAHLPGILSALEKLNLTAEIRSEIHGIKSYVESFQCILMASIWVKVLTAIDTEIKYCKPEVQLWMLKLETYKVLLKI